MYDLGRFNEYCRQDGFYEVGFQTAIMSPFYNCKKLTSAGRYVHCVSEKIYTKT